ncbi:MAG TPA: LytTR family DNA-binding domain-containing protein [Bacteroidia bacterium]|nr:LytTR family DNA-binding domain-containing protein [Bacteroidia bacterium]
MINAIIVDDEKDGREALHKIILNFTKNVNVVAMADSAESAFADIEKYKPDLVFLDIEMPGETGFDLLRKFKSISFKTIFITAHSHYAIKAFKFSAIDYLLKPVDIDDLVEAVKKVETSIPANHTPDYNTFLQEIGKKSPEKIALPLHDGLEYVRISDIIRFEGDGSYTTAYLADGKKIMVSRNIKEYEDLLSENNFFRCHISHLINLHRVKRFSRHDGYYAEMNDGKRVEISRRKKDGFVARMNALS